MDSLKNISFNSLKSKLVANIIMSCLVSLLSTLKEVFIEGHFGIILLYLPIIIGYNLLIFLLYYYLHKTTGKSSISVILASVVLVVFSYLYCGGEIREVLFVSSFSFLLLTLNFSICTQRNILVYLLLLGLIGSSDYLFSSNEKKLEKQEMEALIFTVVSTETPQLLSKYYFLNNRIDFCLKVKAPIKISQNKTIGVINSIEVVKGNKQLIEGFIWDNKELSGKLKASIWVEGLLGECFLNIENAREEEISNIKIIKVRK